jgi:hypothetical protein
MKGANNEAYPAIQELLEALPHLGLLHSSSQSGRIFDHGQDPIVRVDCEVLLMLNPNCSTHFERMGTEKEAVAKVRRLYGEDGKNGFHDFYACEDCLKEILSLASRYHFDVKVERFNRRATDKLGESQ